MFPPDVKNSTFTVMKLTKTTLVFIAILSVCCIEGVQAQTDMDKALRTWNQESVPYIHPENLPMPDSILYVDTREKDEYQVSHLPYAKWVGYKDFNADRFLKEVPDKTQPIIVYCSIGVRSENIGEQLQEMGYTKVLNLYGGIFAWKNLDKEVVNLNGKPTDSVHAFSKHWGRLLEKGIKVY